MNIWFISGSQLGAIAKVRWDMFTHSLRSRKGALELFSRVVVSLVIASGGLGGAVLLGVGSWYFVSHAKPEALALLLWPVFVFWQMFPLMASALTETIDSSHLLRFPLDYRAYVLVRLIYGALDPATVLGGLWLVGIALGAGWARPALFPWAALVLGIFGVVNLLLTQLIFAWVERWLAQRRTREVFAVFFFIALLSLQLIGPMRAATVTALAPRFSTRDVSQVRCKQCFLRGSRRRPWPTSRTEPSRSHGPGLAC